jgi:hypothetical protein
MISYPFRYSYVGTLLLSLSFAVAKRVIDLLFKVSIQNFQNFPKIGNTKMNTYNIYFHRPLSFVQNDNNS